MITLEEFKDWYKRKEALSKLPHETQVMLAVEWAYSVLSIVKDYPDSTARKAIAAAENWLKDSNPNTAQAARAAAYAAYSAYSGNAAYAARAAAQAAWAAGYAIYAGNAAAWAAGYAAWAARNAQWEWMYKTYLGAIPEPLTISSTAKDLITTIKESRDYTLCPILADALEDSGYVGRLLVRLRENIGITRADWIFKLV